LLIFGEETMPHKTIYVTGANADYFLVILPLLQSFEDFCPNEHLFVCDFGFSEEQKIFFSEKGLLLQHPHDLPEGLHPFYYKASIYRFLETIEFDSVVWIDCDCLIVAPLSRFIERCISEFSRTDGPFLAVCPEGLRTIDEMDVAQPFKAFLKHAGIAMDQFYLNSGVFILQSKSFLSEWAKVVFDIEMHTLFEQNMFNYLAYKEFNNFYLLDADIWNVHDKDLNQLIIKRSNSESEGGIYLNDKRVLICHATAFENRGAFVKHVTFVFDELDIRGIFKFIQNDKIRHLQMDGLSRYIHRNYDFFRESGILKASQGDLLRSAM